VKGERERGRENGGETGEEERVTIKKQLSTAHHERKRQ
jgi:hypothetical protein